MTSGSTNETSGQLLNVLGGLASSSSFGGGVDLREPIYAIPPITQAPGK